MALFDCAINEKCCSVDGGQGICRLSSSPPLEICHPTQKKKTNARGSGGRGGGLAQMQLTDALAFHQCEPPIT